MLSFGMEDNMIKIIGLGPGDVDSLTLGTMRELKSGTKVFLRTEKHPTVEYVDEEGVKYETYDHYYNEKESFDEVYKSICDDLIEKVQEYGDLVYGVPGHPLVAEKSVSLLIEECEKKGIEYKMVPAVSFVDAMMECLKIDPVYGLKILDAFDIENNILDKRVGIILTQVYDRYIASEVKLKLGEYYGDDYEIYFVRAAGIEGEEKVVKIPIYELDRMEEIDYLTSLYIPKMEESEKQKHFDFSDLVNIMGTLRGPEGCSWDREQTNESLKRYLIEECYEVIDAIDNDDIDGMIEELGDVLLQVVFHSQIGKEDGYFSVQDVIKGICEKMIRRHPHIFKEHADIESQQVLQNWEKIKEEEKNIESVTEDMKNIPKAMPGLIRAEKIQKKAAKVGFDWEDVKPAMEKVIEELDEIKDVYKTENRSKILEEMGDLIFACVNVARFLKVDPEEAINITNKKFIKRFAFIEEEAEKSGKELKNMTLEEMDELWNRAK